MSEPLDFRRKYRLHREERVYFGDRSISLERCIEDVECAVAPTAPRRTAKRRIAAGPDDAPDFGVERLACECVDGVEQSEVARPSAILGHSGVSPRIQRLDDGENLFGPPLIDEIDGSLVVEHRMARVQPKPRLVRGVKISEPIHNVAEFGDNGLRSEIRRRLAV